MQSMNNAPSTRQDSALRIPHSALERSTHLSSEVLLTKEDHGPRLPRPLHGSMCLAPSQSQRDCVLQPRVARNELPWVGGPLNLNPERVAPETLNTNAWERAGLPS